MRLIVMPNAPFVEDASLILSTFRFILETYKTFRPKKKNGVKGAKEEEALGEAVRKGEETSSKGGSARDVFGDIETELESELGVQRKDEIVARAASLLAFARPFQTDSFQYTEQLFHLLESARNFCKVSNIFELRGTDIRGVENLRMDSFAAAIREIVELGGFPGNVVRIQDLIRASVRDLVATLVPGSDVVSVVINVDLIRSSTMGEGYTEQRAVVYTLTQCEKGNWIGFRISGSAGSGYFVGFEQRITGNQFLTLVKAVAADLKNYVAELSSEEETFREAIKPAIDTILAALKIPTSS